MGTYPAQQSALIASYLSTVLHAAPSISGRDLAGTTAHEENGSGDHHRNPTRRYDSCCPRGLHGDVPTCWGRELACDTQWDKGRFASDLTFGQSFWRVRSYDHAEEVRVPKPRPVVEEQHSQEDEKTRHEGDNSCCSMHGPPSVH